MSYRNLVQDPLEERRKAFSKISKQDTEEALWEALMTLSFQGIDIGSKADAILQLRADIRASTPKKVT